MNTKLDSIKPTSSAQVLPSWLLPSPYPPSPATPLLRRLNAWNGWRHDIIYDAHGLLEAVVYVRVGPVWTDSVAIAGEDQTIALRHRTRESKLIIPSELPSESGAVWQRHGRCEEVLAELCELPESGAR